MNRMLLFKLYLPKLIIMWIIVIFSLHITINSPAYNFDQSQIDSGPKNAVYYNGSKINEVSEYGLQNDMKVEYSPNLAAPQVTPKELNLNVAINSQERVKGESQATYERNKATNMSKVNVSDFGYVISKYPDMINKFSIANEQLGINQVIVGNYPVDETEVMIPEEFAISIIQDGGAKSYRQLVGGNVGIDGLPEKYGKQLKVSGIYQGADNFIIGSSQEVTIDKATGIFIEAESSKEVQQLVEQFGTDGFTMYNHSKLDILVYKSIKFVPVIIFIISLVFICINSYKCTKVLNRYRYRLGNYTMPLVLPIGYNIIIFIIEMYVVK